MKISIITVTYNSAATISDTIKSVLSQTYSEIDYWIIDALSTDATIEIVKKFEKDSHGRLHYISEKDRGIYDAMNKGIAHCTGDIVGILNSDDFFTSNDVIEKMVAEFQKYPSLDAIYGDVHFVKRNNLRKCIRYYSGRIFTPSLIRFGFIPPHPSFYIKKEIFEKYGVYDDTYKISADFELIGRLCYLHKIKTKYLHLDFVTMRVGGASTCNLKARKLGTQEDLIACKNMGIYTNNLFIHLKYFIKIFSTLFIRN